MDLTLWYEAGAWLMRVGFIAIFIFTVRYGTSSPWWKTHAGIALFLRNVAIVAVIALSVLWGILGPPITFPLTPEPFPGFWVVRFFVTLLFAATSVWFYVVYELNKRGKLASPHPDDEGYVVYQPEDPQTTVEASDSPYPPLPLDRSY